MKKTAMLCLLMAFLSVGFQLAHAQDDNESGKTVPAKPEQKAFNAYRVDFAINELEDGKKINSRHYSMNLNAGDRQQLKIGTRVPVATGSVSDSVPANLQFQYIDVGTNITCRLEERGDGISLEVRGDFSNFSSPDEQHASKPVLGQPIIRQIQISGSTLAAPGKAVVIGLVDDPNSNRAFQLEATVTRLR